MGFGKVGKARILYSYLWRGSVGLGKIRARLGHIHILGGAGFCVVRYGIVRYCKVRQGIIFILIKFQGEKMKTKAKSVHVYEVRIWSKKHFINSGKIEKPKGAYENQIYDGLITNSKTKKKKFFKSPAQFMTTIERMYKEDERKKN